MSFLTRVILEAEFISGLEAALASRLGNKRAITPMTGGMRIARVNPPIPTDVTVVGRAPKPAKPRPIRSTKSSVVPEPDQIMSPRPKPRSVVGPLEPQG